MPKILSEMPTQLTKLDVAPLTLGFEKNAIKQL